MSVQVPLTYTGALAELAGDRDVRRREWPEGEVWRRQWVESPPPATLPGEPGETITLVEPTAEDMAALDWETVTSVAPAPEPPPDPPTGNSTAPAWVEDAIAAGWQQGHWTTISGASPGYGLSATNTLHSVNTAGDIATVLQEALIESWTGAALCWGHRSHGTYLMGPGGSHGNYGKGTVYLFDLSTRTWEEVAGADASGLNSSFGEYNSGRAITNHSAWWAYYDAHRNELAYPRGWGSPQSGSDQMPVPYGHGLDLAAYDASGYADTQWRRYPELTGLTGSPGDATTAPSGQFLGLSQQCGCAWDEARKSAWVVAAHNSFSPSGVVAQYDSVADAWTVHPGQFSVFLGCALTVDPTRDLLLATTMLDSTIKVMDLANPGNRFGATNSTASLWTAQATGVSVGSMGGGPSLEWSPQLDGAVYYRWQTSPSDVLVGEYVSGGACVPGQQTDYTLAWRSLTAPGNAVSPPTPTSGGAYSKFRLARWGSREIAIFAPLVDGPVYAFRVT